MDVLIWIGAAISLLGLGGILYCIYAAMRARATAADDSELRTTLQRIVTINLAAFFVSVLGLMCIVVGIFL